MFHTTWDKANVYMLLHKHKKNKKNKYKPLYMRIRAFMSQLGCETCLHVAFTNTKKIYILNLYTTKIF
jgi:hypothetical protein